MYEIDDNSVWTNCTRCHNEPIANTHRFVMLCKKCIDELKTRCYWCGMPIVRDKCSNGCSSTGREYLKELGINVNEN